MSNSDTIRSKVMAYQKEQLRKLAEENSNVTVYERDDSENAFAKSMAWVRPRLLKARQWFHYLRQQEPTWKDADIREVILNMHPDVKELMAYGEPGDEDYYAGYNTLFVKLTSRNTTDQIAQDIWDMINKRERIERGMEDAQQADIDIGKFADQRTGGGMPKRLSKADKISQRKQAKKERLNRNKQGIASVEQEAEAKKQAEIQKLDAQIANIMTSVGLNNDDDDDTK
jgi:hypothetical protein